MDLSLFDLARPGTWIFTGTGFLALALAIFFAYAALVQATEDLRLWIQRRRTTKKVEAVAHTEDSAG